MQRNRRCDVHAPTRNMASVQRCNTQGATDNMQHTPLQRCNTQCATDSVAALQRCADLQLVLDRRGAQDLELGLDLLCDRLEPRGARRDRERRLGVLRKPRLPAVVSRTARYPATAWYPSRHIRTQGGYARRVLTACTAGTHSVGPACTALGATGALPAPRLR